MTARSSPERSIFVVDDEAIVTLDLTMRLERLGYTVAGTARNAEGAVEGVGRTRPDLVLMDIRLGGPRDGIDAAREIHETLDLPVVFVSAFADEATLTRAMQTLPLGYVMKPVDDRELAAAIELALYKSETERSLRRMEQWLATTLHSIADAVIATDVAGRVTLFNGVAAEMTGWPREEALGRPLLEVLTLEAEGQRFDPVAAVLGGAPAPPGRTLELAGSGGRRIPVSDSSSPIRDGRDQVMGVVVVLRDVSALRRAQEELRAGDRMLQEARRMEVIGRLAGGIAHDYNNAMTVILGQGEMILADPEVSAQTRDTVADIVSAARRVAELTRRLLAYGRRLVLRPERIDPGKLVEGALPALRRLLPDDVRLETPRREGLWPLRIDRSYFEQALLCLAMNSRDAMPRGGRLAIRAANRSLEAPFALRGEVLPAGDYVLLTVEDDGVGMGPETLDHLFEPFYTTKAQSPGAGLGLATVEGIVKQSGGSLHVESAKDAGTRVEIWLPRCSESAAPEARPALTASTLPGGDETILLVDDDDAARRVTRRSLEALGYSVVETRSGREALVLAAEPGNGFALLLTDIVMPGMSGTELAERLRGLRPHLKVLFFSGYSEEMVGGEGALGPGRRFLGKPYLLRDLARSVRELIDWRWPD